MEQRAEADRLDLLLAETERKAEPHREQRQSLAVAAHALLAGFDRVGEGARQSRGEEALAEIALGAPRAVEGPLERLVELLLRERLRDEPVGSAAKGFGQVVARVRARDEHDRKVRPVQAHRLEQLEPGEVGHDDVREHEADPLVDEERQRLGCARSADDLVAGRLEHVAHDLAGDGLVVDDEHAGHEARSRGSRRT